MNLKTLSASLISAGLASIATAYFVEKKMAKEFSDLVDEKVAASVKFLVETGKAESDDYEQHKALFGTPFVETPVDERDGVNQRTRYDLVIKSTGYSPEEVVSAEDGTLMLAEAPEVCETEPEILAIPTDEFMENENGYLQSSLNYFADGGVLDEQGELVVDFVDLIGNAVPPFGQLSGEPHIVYLRNNRLRREFEVVFDEANAADILADPGSTP